MKLSSKCLSTSNFVWFAVRLSRQMSKQSAPKQSTPKVAVIGAGVSGVLATAYLKAAGLDVTVFERSFQSGGVWYGTDVTESQGEGS